MNRVFVEASAFFAHLVVEDRDHARVHEPPHGHVRDFPGYDELLLTFEELERIVLHPEANRVWHSVLRGVAEQAEARTRAYGLNGN